MNYKNLVRVNHNRFSSLEGSEYIASDFALEIILKLVKKYEVKNIFEMGLGIGCIVDTILKYSKDQSLAIHYTGTEANEFCLKALKTNVEDYSKIDLYPRLDSLKEQTYDMIIIDGQDEGFSEIAKHCNGNTIIFIEGDRAPQTRNILSIFPNSKHVNIITLKKREAQSNREAHYVGGGQLIFVNPTMERKLFWFKEKVSTYIKRRLRKNIK